MLNCMEPIKIIQNNREITGTLVSMQLNNRDCVQYNLASHFNSNYGVHLNMYTSSCTFEIINTEIKDIEVNYKNMLSIDIELDELNKIIEV